MSKAAPRLYPLPTSIYLPPQTVEQLDAMATADCRSRSNLIVWLADQEWRRREPASEGAFRPRSGQNAAEGES